MKTPEPPRSLQLSPDNPWPGLQSFDEESSSFFFGRQGETDTLFRLVRREKLTVFYGRSGLGKTSLLHAGLFPLLRAANLFPVTIRLDYGAKAPPGITQVKQSIAAALQSGGIDARPPREEESLWEYFHSADLDFWDAQNRLYSLVLVFDQFEERFTLGRQSAETDRDAEAFLTELSELIENRPPSALRARFETEPGSVGHYDFDKNHCKVVLGLREDFLPELESLRDRFPGILENSFRLQEMSKTAAMEVIRKPAPSLVTEEVASEIIRFVGGSDEQDQPVDCRVEPVLLSVVLYELNQRRRKDRQAVITSDLLSGSREEILTGFYENALTGLPPNVRRMLEDALLTSSGRRDSLAWEDIHPVFGVEEEHVFTLINRHLLRREDRADGARIELVHDRLAEVVRKQRDKRHEEEQQAREKAALEARQAELEHEKEAQRRKFRRLTAVCVALAFFTLAITAYHFWDAYQHKWLKESYFETFTKRWGIPEGVGPLSKDQIAGRSCSIKFIRRGAIGPVIHIEAVDSSGRLTPKNRVGTYFAYVGDKDNPNHECQWEYIRDAEGRIAYEVAYDRNKSLVWGFVYSPVVGDPLKRVANFLGANGLPQPQAKSAADFVQIEYWPDGLEKQLTYTDRFGNAEVGRDGNYKMYMEYNPQGMPVKEVSMDSTGKPMPDKDGMSTTVTRYDSKGNIVELYALDNEGKPINSKNGWHRITLAYDASGNRVEYDYFNTKNQPCLTADGYAKTTSKYDKYGNQVEWACFDTEGKPCLTTDGYARSTSAYDDRGNELEHAYFGPHGEPVIDQSLGEHIVRSAYDSRGNHIEWDYFDVNGKPCLTKDGYGKSTAKYDSRGNQVEWDYFDATGKPCLMKDGYQRTTAAYDERNNPVEWDYFDAHGEPCLTKDGHAKSTAKYDEQGNQVEWACFDASGKPCLTKEGYARTTGVYDKQGNTVEIAYFDENGMPTINQTIGSHLIKKTYDKLRNWIYAENFGVDGRPCLTKEGYSKVSRKCDERGNEVELACFGINGEPVVDQVDGYHILKNAYDERGNRIEWDYFDVNGKPVPTKELYAKSTAKYDAHGNQVDWECFDVDGKPCLAREGYEKAITKYDERGNPVEWDYFDTAGQPAVNHDVGGHIIKKAYDDRGNEVEWMCFGVNGKPCLTDNGYAKSTARYDDRGNDVEVAYFDTDYQPAINKSIGCQLLKKSFDERGNCVTWEYFGTDGKPCESKNGYVKVTAQYDGRDRETQSTCFEAGGDSMVSLYDEHGNKYEWSYFGPDGKPHPGNDGCATFKAKFDRFGNEVDLSCFNESGQPAIDQSEGAHELKMSYDPDGNCIMWEYFGVNGMPCLTSGGFFRQTSKYDSSGRQIEWDYFGLDGKPILRMEGYQKLTAQYGATDAQTVLTYMDTTGNPVPMRSGLKLTGISSQGQAVSLGLLAGDIIVSYEDWQIPSAQQPQSISVISDAFKKLILAPGDQPRKLVILRGRELKGFEVKPGLLGVTFELQIVPEKWLKIH